MPAARCGDAIAELARATRRAHARGDNFGGAIRIRRGKPAAYPYGCPAGKFQRCTHSVARPGGGPASDSDLAARVHVSSSFEALSDHRNGIAVNDPLDLDLHAQEGLSMVDQARPPAPHCARPHCARPARFAMYITLLLVAP